MRCINSASGVSVRPGLRLGVPLETAFLETYDLFDLPNWHACDGDRGTN
jgi:hypothetical protein